MMHTETERTASESTPLLAGQEGAPQRYDDDRPAQDSVDQSSDPTKPEETTEGRRARWPTIISLIVLCLAIIAILCFCFAFPSVISQYSQEAAVFEPQVLSIAAFTPTGVRTRIQGSLVLDANRVGKKSVRDLGRFGTWLAKEVESRESTVQVYLPEYGNVLVGTATIPPIKVNIRNGHVNNLDFFANLTAGDIDGIRVVGNDWLDGRLEQLYVRGVASVPLRSGILDLGSQDISERFVLEDHGLPGSPGYNITKLNIHDTTGPRNSSAVVADVTVSVHNDYPIKLTVPPVAFQILVPNCKPDDENILVGNATTEEIRINPRQPAIVGARSFIHDFPDELTNICPGETSSPLDLLLEKYIQGNTSTIYVSGDGTQPPNAPSWFGEMFNNLTAPIPFTSHGLSGLVKRFSMTDVHISLPEPLAEPDTPDAQPKFSSHVKVAVALPKQMNFPVNISRVRSSADVYYDGETLGYIDLREWQKANTTKNETAPSSSPELLVQFDIQKAPLQVTNEDAFTDVLQKLVFKGESVSLNVSAKVDADTETPMGEFIIRDIPASGRLDLKPPIRGGFADFDPKIEAIQISETTKTSVKVLTNVTFTNPTNYSADIPYIKMKLAFHGTDVAHVLSRNLSISPGVNSGVEVVGLWDPTEAGGEEGARSGRDLLSDYVSGMNTSITLGSYEGTIPALPSLGRTLSELKLNVSIPRTQLPGDGDDSPDRDPDHFIQGATFHLWSSTAVFTLASPLPSTTLYIASINATAFYDHDKPLGRIQRDIPLAVPPGISQTPRLPVDLDLGGNGYEVLKKALGGTLQLDTIADVRVKLDQYVDVLNYRGSGITARVRI